MLITRSSSFEYGVRKRTLARTFAIGPISIRFILIILVMVLGIFYLVQKTKSATENVQLMNLEQRFQQLDTEKERLELETTRLRSLKTISEQVNSLGLEPIKQINTLPADSGLVHERP